MASLWDRITTETWPAKMARALIGAVTLPGDVYAGRVPVTDDSGQTSPEVVNRSADLAGLLTLGSGAVPAAGNEMRMGIKAYHGSPYDFEKFDLSKIGTGEGAQAYGHGLYFAENPQVAREYKARLSGGPIVGGVDPFRDMSWLSTNTKGVAAQALEDSLRSGLSGDDAVRDAIGSLTSTVANFPNMEAPTRQAHYDAANAIGSLLGKEWQRNPGRMYEVNINADPQQFLDWDKPLSQMSPEVQQRLNESWLAHPIDHAHQTGGQIYESARIVPGDYRDPMAASKTLADAGIPGIKYLDQLSRPDMRRANDLRAEAADHLANGRDQYAAEANKLADAIENSGTRNYVVFNPDIIDILKKYGLSGAAPTAAMAKALLSNQDEQQ